MLAQVKRIHLWPYTMQFSAQNEIIALHRQRLESSPVMPSCIKENLFLVQFIFFPVPMSIAAQLFFTLSFNLIFFEPYFNVCFFCVCDLLLCSSSPWFVYIQRQCLLGKHTRSSNEKHASEIMSHRFILFRLCTHSCCSSLLTTIVVAVAICSHCLVHQCALFRCAMVSFRRNMDDDI